MSHFVTIEKNLEKVKDKDNSNFVKLKLDVYR